jgi:hypothetical protein
MELPRFHLPGVHVFICYVTDICTRKRALSRVRKQQVTAVGYQSMFFSETCATDIGITCLRCLCYPYVSAWIVFGGISPITNTIDN